MSVGYILANRSKKEVIRFLNLPVNTAREIAGNPISASIVTWYLLKNSGDQIAFIDDSSGALGDIDSFEDVTEAVVEELVARGVLEDRGIEWRDDDEPDTVFMRDLRNVWMK